MAERTSFPFLTETWPPGRPTFANAGGRRSLPCPWALLAVGLLALLLPSTPAAGANLAKNAQFGTSAQLWSLTSASGELTFDPNNDADSLPGSGSARLRNTGLSDNVLTIVAQCVFGFPDERKRYIHARTRFAPGETKAGFVQILVFYYPTQNCSGGASQLDFANSRSTADGRGVWLTHSYGSIANSPGYNGPAGSARIQIRLGKAEGGGMLTANVDNILIGTVGEPLCNGLAPTLGGTEGPDSIDGTAGPDVIVGLAGDDTIKGLGSDDTICGGIGDDEILGGGGADFLSGEQGDDTLRGGGGGDELRGGSDDDTLRGNSGNDFLKGNGGLDSLNGGTDTDVCEGDTGNGDTATGCETTSGVP